MAAGGCYVNRHVRLPADREQDTWEEEVYLGIRPEDFHETLGPGENALLFEVEIREMLGARTASL